MAIGQIFGKNIWYCKTASGTTTFEPGVTGTNLQLEAWVDNCRANGGIVSNGIFAEALGKGVKGRGNVPNSIDVMSLQRGDIDAWTEFSWHYWPEKVRQIFKVLGLDVSDEAQLRYLANLHRRGGDINGELKSAQGKPIVFNLLKMLRSIPMDMERFVKSFDGAPGFKLVKK